MYKVLLFSTRRPEEVETYWDPYQYLQRAFKSGSDKFCSLTDSPEAADLIIICPSVSFKNPVFPREIFRSSILLKYGKKCVVFGVNDEATIVHKGFYTSLSATKNRSNLLSGGVYLHTVYAPPHEAYSINIEFKYLFSFLGNFSNHAIRTELGSLVEAFSSSLSTMGVGLGFLLQDTSRSQTEFELNSETEKDYKNTYLDSIRESKFILCPRGGCPSSVRVFETMKAGRVPVIISDEWVPPPEIPWKSFAVFVKERDVRRIPEILKYEETSFVERALAARKAWDDFLAAEVLPITISRWGMSLIETSRNSRNGGHLWELSKQSFTWRFIRRGLLSELHGLLKSR